MPRKKKKALQRAWESLASLELTLVLLLALMVLVVAGTLHQVQLGIYLAQKKYFESWFIWHAPFSLSFAIPIFPGGFTVGGLLLANLLCAHFKRFQWRREKTGIWLVHAGLILLLIGQFFTAVVATESQIAFEEGETIRWSQSLDRHELAVIDETDEDADTLFSVPTGLLAGKEAIALPKTSLRLIPVAYHPNAELRGLPEGHPGGAADRGVGKTIVPSPRPVETAEDRRNFPAAIVEIFSNEEKLGRWLVSSALGAKQAFRVGERRYRLELRPKRYHFPYSLTLLDFTHDRYPGTEIPKNFASDIRLVNPDSGEDREIRIYMNHPLRYDGKAFFQASFGKNDTLSVLQVVENPGWTIPYIACVLVAAGLLWQFGFSLNRHLRERRG